MSATRERAAHLGPQRRRPMVLDAALSVFLEHGYDDTSMDAIAGAAGVSKPVIYDCYASKQELFAALLEREEQRVLAQITKAIPANAPEDPQRALAEGLEAFLTAVAASPETYRVMFLGEGGGSAAIAERVRSGRFVLLDALAPLAADWLRGQGVADPERIARLIGHMLIGVSEASARALLAEPERWQPKTMADTLARMIVHGQGALLLK